MESDSDPRSDEGNAEGTGARATDLALSAILRHADGVRHMDLDVLQWCGTCNAWQFAAESYGGAYPDKKPTHRTELVAKALGVPCYLFWLARDESGEVYRVTVVLVRGRSRYELGVHSIESFVSWLESRPCGCR